MRFAFTDDQLGFRDSLRDVFANECPPTALRACWTSESGRVPGLWRKLGELGLLGITAPEVHGGLGLGAVDLVLPLEEAGRAALPEPLIEHAAVAIPVLEAYAPATVQAAWLPRAATGGATVTVALDGAPFVLAADTADLVLAWSGGELRAVEPSALALRRCRSVDGARRLFAIVAGGEKGELLCDGEDAQRAAREAFDRGALGAAAELLGLGAAVLDLTVSYVKVREQFGKAIGSFQAIKHHLANALTALEMARPLVYRAAASVAASGGESSLHVSIAKARASSVAHQVARVALQCHGAIGYSTEYDLHLWMKRIWALAAEWGDPAHHRARIAAALASGREVYP